MPQHVIFAAPFFMDATLRFIGGATRLPDVALTVLSQDPAEKMPAGLRAGIAGHWRLDDALDARQLVDGARNLERQFGRARRMIGALEQLQVPLAAAREVLGIEGLSVDAAMNFRDKSRMKQALSRAGVPCAARAGPRPLVGGGLRGRGRLPAGGKAAGRRRRQEHVPARRTRRTRAVSRSLPAGSAAAGALRGIRARHGIFLRQCRDRQTAGVAFHWPLHAVAARGAREHVDPVVRPVAARHRRSGVRPDPARRLRRAPGARLAHGTLAHGMVPAARWQDRHLRGRRPAARHAVHVAPVLGARRRLLSRLAAPDGIRCLRAAGAPPCGGRGLRARPGPRAGTTYPRPGETQRRFGCLVVEAKLPREGQPPSDSYEGDGYVILRHADTAVLERALRQIVQIIRVELA